MRVPQKGTIAYKICVLLRTRGPMTLPMIWCELPSSNKATIRHALHDHSIVANGDGAYELPLHLKNYFNDCETVEKPKVAQNVLLPPYHPPFRALQPKNIPSLEARRPDAGPAREISFKTGGTIPNAKLQGYSVR